MGGTLGSRAAFAVSLLNDRGESPLSAWTAPVLLDATPLPPSSVQVTISTNDGAVTASPAGFTGAVDLFGLKKTRALVKVGACAVVGAAPTELLEIVMRRGRAEETPAELYGRKAASGVKSAVPSAQFNNGCLVTFEGLQPGQEYAFAARGINSVGDGDWTSWHTIRTEEAPVVVPPPSSVVVRRTQKASCTVTVPPVPVGALFQVTTYQLAYTTSTPTTDAGDLDERAIVAATVPLGHDQITIDDLHTDETYYWIARWVGLRRAGPIDGDGTEPFPSAAAAATNKHLSMRRSSSSRSTISVLAAASASPTGGTVRSAGPSRRASAIGLLKKQNSGSAGNSGAGNGNGNSSSNGAKPEIIASAWSASPTLLAMPQRMEEEDGIGTRSGSGGAEGSALLLMTTDAVARTSLRALPDASATEALIAAHALESLQLSADQEASFEKPGKVQAPQTTAIKSARPLAPVKAPASYRKTTARPLPASSPATRQAPTEASRRTVKNVPAGNAGDA